MRLLLLLRRRQQRHHHHHHHHRMPYCHVQRHYHHSYPPYRVRVTVVSEVVLHYSIVQVVGAIPVVAFMRVVVTVTVVVVTVVVVVLTATVPMITTTIVKIVISAEPMYHRCYHRYYVPGMRVISVRSNHPYRHRYSLPPITTMMYTTIRMIRVVPVV